MISPSQTNLFYDLQLSHRGATFYTLLWKTHLFIGAEFKPIAIFSEANILNRLLIRFQICILCTFGCLKSGQPIFHGHSSNFNKWNLDNGLAAMIGLGNFAVSSFDHLWANHNKISPFDLVMDKSVQMYSRT